MKTNGIHACESYLCLSVNFCITEQTFPQASPYKFQTSSLITGTNEQMAAVYHHSSITGFNAPVEIQTTVSDISLQNIVRNNYPIILENFLNPILVTTKSFYSLKTMNPTLKDHPLFYETHAVQSLKPNHSCEAIRIISPQKLRRMTRIVH